MNPPEEIPGSGDETEQFAGPKKSEQDQFAAIAQSEFHNRRRRDSLIRHDVFAEPAWDLLLELYVQHHRQNPVGLDRLCGIAAAGPATALRWIGLLMEKGLVTRLPPGGASADLQVALSAKGVEEMERYLRDFLHREQLGGDVAAGLHRS